MKYYAFAHRLPEVIAGKLFGARKEFGLVPDESDSCWIEWQKTYHDFYENTQQEGVGDYVNNAGYRVMTKHDLTGKKVLEIGPGKLPHMDYWNSKPEHYVIADIDEHFLQKASSILEKNNVAHEKRLASRGKIHIPANEAEFDIIVSFFSLEHLYPFEKYLDEFSRVLKPGGKLIGAIPAEGGLAWGFGRYLTSRRWLKKHTSINPDKIICWEHPNFADYMLTMLDERFERGALSYWPLLVNSIDLNLVIQFEFEKNN